MTSAISPAAARPPARSRSTRSTRTCSRSSFRSGSSLSHHRNKRTTVPAACSPRFAASSTKPSVPASATKSPEVFVGRGAASAAPDADHVELHRQEVRELRRRLRRRRERHELGRRLGKASRGAQRRHDVARRAYERRHGIAGQREDRLAARARPEPHRLARALPDLVETRAGRRAPRARPARDRIGPSRRRRSARARPSRRRAARSPRASAADSSRRRDRVTRASRCSVRLASIARSLLERI